MAPFRYGQPLDYLVREFKFRRRLYLARPLGRLLADALAASDEPPDLIIPVPLHRRRLRERGFNQSAELARIVSRQLDLPVDYGACRRTRFTESQSSLPAKERRANVRNAFATRNRYDEKHIAIVDDVMTTGNTVEELARCLLRAGAERVDIWVVARAGQGAG